MLLKYELKKQLEKPFCIIAAACCAVFNIIFMLRWDYPLDNINMQSEIVRQLGTVYVTDENSALITDPEMKKMIAGYTDEYIELNRESAHILLQDNMEVSLFDLAGEQVEFVHKLSDERLAARFDEMYKTKEPNAINGGDDIFQVLFLGAVLVTSIESALFAVLIAAKTAGHEFSNRAEQIIYTTRKGRKIMHTKLAAAAILTAGFCLTVFALSFAVFLLRCPCFELLGAPMCLNAGRTFLYTWFACPMWVYLLLNVLLAIALSEVICLMSFAVFGFSRNTAVAVMLTVLLLAAGIVIGKTLPQWGYLRLISYTFPSIQLLMSGAWLAVDRVSVPICGFEVFSIAVWAAMMLLLCGFAMKRFERNSI